eukprot:gene3408-3887_t
MPNGNRHPAVQPTTSENVVGHREGSDNDACLCLRCPAASGKPPRQRNAYWRVGITRAAAPSPSQTLQHYTPHHCRNGLIYTSTNQPLPHLAHTLGMVISQ